MPLEFNPALLEPTGIEDGETVPASMLATIIAYSQAVSLKRIADALERDDIRTVAIEPEIIAEQMITLRAGGATPAEPADDTSIPAAPKQRVKHAALPASAIAEGFIPHDNSPTAPIDRNREVMAFHANGKARRGFGGAINWATKPDDPWRVLGWRDLGDGALNSGGA